jgi:hypothetical protein
MAQILKQTSSSLFSEKMNQQRADRAADGKRFS